MTRHMMMLAAAITLMTVAPPPHVFAQSPTTTTFVNEQPANEWLARVFLGAPVQNTAGETVGEITDLMFSPSGQISTAVIGVGGFLGIGEKNVAVPYSALIFKSDKDSARVIVVAITKDGLSDAPAFKAREKTTMDLVKDKAVDLEQKAVVKAGELKDKAAKKIDDMTTSTTVKK